MMPASATFDYAFVVPDGPKSGSRKMQGALRHPLKWYEQRFVGRHPILEAVEYQKEAWQLYSRITLTPGGWGRAGATSFTLSVDRGLMVMLRPADVVHISRTHAGGVGLSVLREDRLVAAAGAITHVPLGVDVTVGHPVDLIGQAAAVFRARDPQYRISDNPIEIRVGNVTRLLSIGGATLGDYDIRVHHGCVLGYPGRDECVSVERQGWCPDLAAHTSAELIDARV